jgi:glutamate/tyrosine decarboxylase-like PLP-dependent enzyme
VRDPEALRAAFSYHPTYYRTGVDSDDAPTNFFELGMQNSRGFRALKVWLSLRQAGRQGYTRLIADDIALSREMEKALRAHPEMEVVTQNLSICTFRYMPKGAGSLGEEYLNKLNSAILAAIQEGGKAFVSNAVVGGKMLLRACVVNFRTTVEDVRALPGIVAGYGRTIHARIGPRGD